MLVGEKAAEMAAKSVVWMAESLVVGRVGEKAVTKVFWMAGVMAVLWVALKDHLLVVVKAAEMAAK